MGLAAHQPTSFLSSSRAGVACMTQLDTTRTLDERNILFWPACGRRSSSGMPGGYEQMVLAAHPSPHLPQIIMSCGGAHDMLDTSRTLPADGVSAACKSTSLITTCECCLFIPSHMQGQEHGQTQGAWSPHLGLPAPLHARVRPCQPVLHQRARRQGRLCRMEPLLDRDHCRKKGKQVGRGWKRVNERHGRQGRQSE